jgi:hypothetical protein
MNPSQQLDEVKALLLYSEIFYQRPTPALIKTLLARLNRFQFMNFVCALSAIMHNNGSIAMDRTWQIGFVQGLGPVLGAGRVISTLAASNQILVHELQLGLLARYALQYCQDGDTLGSFAELALRLLLAINELHTQTQKIDDSTSPRRAFFKIEAQSAVLPNQRFAHVVQRYYRLFRWFDTLPIEAEDWLPLRSDFQRLISMSPAEYLAAAFSVLSHFLAIRSASDLAEHPPFFILSQFGSTLTKREKLDMWIHRFSQHDYELSRPSLEPTFTVSDLAPFIEKPLVTLGEEHFFCPMPSLLEDTLNTRIYFDLFAAYQAVDGAEAAKRFSRLQGHFLESYVAELVALMLPPDYTQYAEIRYAAPGGHRKSTDVVGIRTGDGAAVFIEVTKTRFRLTESLFALDEVAVMKDIDSMVLRKAKQIQRSIDDLAAGLYCYAETVTRIAPVVVTGQGIPGLIYLKYRIDEELKRSGVLQTCEPLLYCDIEEIEALALASPHNVDLYSLLAEKGRHADVLAKVQSLKNYLHYYRTDISRKHEPRETVFPEFKEASHHMIEPTLRSWGLSITFQTPHTDGNGN